ncbi:MAG: pilus assembly protein TadG-related protein [Myxococcota bacterium]
MKHRLRTSSRRGSFATLYAVSAFAFLCMSALAVDTMLIRLARAETQAVADATCHSALLRLRATGDRAHAAEIAEAVVRENAVTGSPATLESIEFGMWTDGGARFRSAAVRNGRARVTESTGVAS